MHTKEGRANASHLASVLIMDLHIETKFVSRENVSIGR